MPPDALLYAHLSTERARPQDARLLAIAGRFSSPGAAPALGMAFTPGAGGLDFERDVQPWLGDDAAFALLGAPARACSSPPSRPRGGGRRCDASARRPPASTGRRAGRSRRAPPPRSPGEHLVIGPAAAVRGAIDRAPATRHAALADGRIFRRAAEERGGAASARRFAPPPALRRLLDGRAGLAGLAGRLVDEPAARGRERLVAAEEAACGSPAACCARRRRPRARVRARRWPAACRDGAAGFLALPGARRAAGVVARAGGGALLEGLREALPQAAGLELDDLLEPLAGEAALSVTAGEAGPVVHVAARTRDEARTREALARLQGPGRRAARRRRAVRPARRCAAPTRSRCRSPTSWSRPTRSPTDALVASTAAVGPRAARPPGLR